MKIIKRLVTLIFIFGIIGALGLLVTNIYVEMSIKGRIINEEKASKLHADCILVLGAGVYSNGKPSPMLVDRLSEGVHLYKLGASEKLLMSGDHSRVNYDEVDVMKNYAKDKGVSSKNIFMDHAGFSTYESMYRARDIFKSKKIIIVTQKYHMYRALYIAKKLGLNAYGVPSDPRTYGGQTIRDLREVLARTKDVVNVIIQPKPTYLGDSIPISGNGDSTNG